MSAPIYTETPMKEAKAIGTSPKLKNLTSPKGGKKMSMLLKQSLRKLDSFKEIEDATKNHKEAVSK